MHDLDIVKRLQPADHLYQAVPNLRLLEVCAIGLMLHDLLVQISVVTVLHHDAHRVVVLVNEDFLVLDDIFVAHPRQDSDLVDGISALFLSQVVDPDFLQGVVLLIGLSIHMVDT